MAVNIDYTGSNGPAFLEGIETDRIAEATADAETTQADGELIYGSGGPRLKAVTGAIHTRNNADDDFADFQCESLVVNADLSVLGTTTTIESTVVEIADVTFTLAKNQTGVGNQDAGIVVERGSLTDSQVIWDESEGYWTHGVVGTMLRMGDMVDPTTTQGDVIVRGATAIERLGIGGVGTVLTVNGAGTGFTWTAVTGTVPNGTITNQHLEWSGLAWVAQADMTMATGVGRQISQENVADASANTFGIVGSSSTTSGNQGGGLTLSAGTNTALNGAGGDTLIHGGPGLGAGNAGGVLDLKGGTATVGNGGRASLEGGDSGGAGDGGDVHIAGGVSSTGTNGQVKFSDTDDGYTEVAFPTDSSTTADGTRVVTDLYFKNGGDDGTVTIAVEDTPSGSGGGTNIKLAAGRPEDAYDGGGVIVEATTGGSSNGSADGGYGGSIVIQAGSGGSGGTTYNPGPGGEVLIAAGYGSIGGTNNSNGGHVNVAPGSGTGTGTHGAVRIGNSTLANPTLLFRSTDFTNPTTVNGPGLRYNSTTNAVEVCNDGAGTWAAITSGTALPSPIAYGHIEGNSAGSAWTTVSDITLPDGGARTITMQTKSTAAASEALYIRGQQANAGGYVGGELVLMGGLATGAGQGGSVKIYGGDGPGAGVSGTINIGTGGTYDGTIYIGADDGSASIIVDMSTKNIDIAAGSGATRLSDSIEFGTAGLGDAQINMQATANTVVVSDIQFEAKDHYIKMLNNGAGAGANLTISAGWASALTYSGGDLTLVAGSAQVNGVNGGSTYINAGLASTGVDGDVIIGSASTVRLEFGIFGGNSIEYQFQANTTNRLVTGGDGNTIVMHGDTSHTILIDTPSSASNGDILRIRAGAANGAANNGGGLFLNSGEGGASGVDGDIVIGHQHCEQIEFGSGNSVKYMFQANTSNRLYAGVDGNTIVMSNTGDHKILVDQSSGTTGYDLYVAAGEGDTGDDGGGLYLDAGAGLVPGSVYIGTLNADATYVGTDAIHQYTDSNYAQRFVVWSGVTSAANTWTTLQSSSISAESCLMLEIMFTARDNTTGTVASYKYKAVISRTTTAASSALDNTVKETLHNGIGVNTDVRVAVNTGTGTYDVDVKSNNANACRWVAAIRVCEVQF